MRIFSGLTGKMAPVAGPRGKAAPTPPAAFTPVQHKVTLVSQRRRGSAAEVQQQAGAAAAAAAAASTMVAPHSGSVESEAGTGNKFCSGSCPPAPDSSGGGTTGSHRMERGAGQHLSTSTGGSSRYSRDAGLSRKGRAAEPASCRDGSRDSRGADATNNGRGTENPQTRDSRSSRSRVRQYRKRVCVRWGSLQWSLALVLVVRSAAAAGCQGGAHHYAVAAARPLTVA